MMSNTTPVALVAGAVILLALIGCTTFLAWKGIISGDAAISFFGGISLAGIVGGAQHAGVSSGARAAKRKETV